MSIHSQHFQLIRNYPSSQMDAFIQAFVRLFAREFFLAILILKVYMAWTVLYCIFFIIVAVNVIDLSVLPFYAIYF